MKKAKFTSRVKGIKRIVLPLIFSSIERIDTISTAMELRRFGQYERGEPWYIKKQLKKDDYVVLCLTLILLMLVVTLFFK